MSVTAAPSLLFSPSASPSSTPSTTPCGGCVASSAANNGAIVGATVGLICAGLTISCLIYWTMVRWLRGSLPCWDEVEKAPAAVRRIAPRRGDDSPSFEAANPMPVGLRDLALQRRAHVPDMLRDPLPLPKAPSLLAANESDDPVGLA